eukprot:TRINITY_DN9502_c0_g1_i1.p1 TRINITY_DN9502_c0_g1~~TRINITY_DN9502_c0_g1_i1.p1  ORF type:complete len:375 (-),score=78.35 TRINITY_DN9502_c0_g1_i1:14-1138(-)
MTMVDEEVWPAPSELNDIRMIFMIGGTLGMISSMFIMITYFKFLITGKSRNAFVFFLALSDFMLCVKWIVTTTLVGKIDQFAYIPTSVPKNDPCFWIGTYGYFWAMSSLSWNLMISVRLVRSFVRGASGPAHKYKIGISYHAFVWGSSLICTAIIVYLGEFGRSQMGCYISSKLLMYIFMIAPIGLYVISCSIILIIMHVKINQAKIDAGPMSSQNLMRKKESSFRNQLYKYTLVFVLVWSVNLLSIVFTEMIIVLDFNIILIIRVFCVTIQALANSLVWATSPTFLKYIASGIRASSSSSSSFSSSSSRRYSSSSSSPSPFPSSLSSQQYAASAADERTSLIYNHQRRSSLPYALGIQDRDQQPNTINNNSII